MSRSITSIKHLACVLSVCAAAGGCAAGETVQEDPADTTEETVYMEIMIGETAVETVWEDNETVRALYEEVQNGDLQIAMSMYGGFEQVGALGFDLPRDDRRTTTQPGDLVLYQGNQIVVFYGTNTWEYTGLGHIADQSEEDLRTLLGNGNVTLTLRKEGQ